MLCARARYLSVRATCLRARARYLSVCARVCACALPVCATQADYSSFVRQFRTSGGLFFIPFFSLCLCHDGPQTHTHAQHMLCTRGLHMCASAVHDTTFRAPQTPLPAILKPLLTYQQRGDFAVDTHAHARTHTHTHAHTRTHTHARAHTHTFVCI